MDISIVLPAYQEEENLKILIAQIQKELKELNCKYQIIIVDTETKMDSTEEVCNELGVEYIQRQNGNTYGAGIRTGIKKAVGKKTIIMDADGSHSPTYLKEMYKQSLEFDMVVGSRYVKGGQTENNAILILMSLTVNLAYRVFLKIKIKDASNSFRLYDSAQLKNISTTCDHFDLVEEILIKLMLDNPGFRIKEIPITFKKRNYGKSKRNLIKFVFSYIETINRLLKIKREYRKNLVPIVDKKTDVNQWGKEQ